MAISYVRLSIHLFVSAALGSYLGSEGWARIPIISYYSAHKLAIWMHRKRQKQSMWPLHDPKAKWIFFRCSSDGKSVVMFSTGRLRRPSISINTKLTHPAACFSRKIPTIAKCLYVVCLLSSCQWNHKRRESMTHTAVVFIFLGYLSVVVAAKTAFLSWCWWCLCLLRKWSQESYSIFLSVQERKKLFNSCGSTVSIVLVVWKTHINSIERKRRLKEINAFEEMTRIKMKFPFVSSFQAKWATAHNCNGIVSACFATHWIVTKAGGVEQEFLRERNYAMYRLQKTSRLLPPS